MDFSLFCVLFITVQKFSIFLILVEMIFVTFLGNRVGLGRCPDLRNPDLGGYTTVRHIL